MSVRVHPQRTCVKMTYVMYRLYAWYMTDAANGIPVSELRAHLADVLNEASRSGTRTFVTRAGKRIAAIISPKRPTCSKMLKTPT